MFTRDKRIDDYIDKAQPFAQPVMKHLRELVHTSCPEVKETIKWGMPSFEYKGPMFGFASFKQHCVIGFWKYKLLNDPKGYIQERSNSGGDAMGNSGRITSLKDLPPDKALIDFVKQHMKLNDEGIKVVKKKPVAKKELVIPNELLDELNKIKNKKAKDVFEKFSPSKKLDYIEWITEAKTEGTKSMRLATTIEWLAEGKSRNWKYERK